MSPNKARQERKLRRRRVISNQEAKQFRESLRRGTTEIISTPDELMELLDQSQELDRDANYDEDEHASELGVQGAISSTVGDVMLPVPVNVFTQIKDWRSFNSSIMDWQYRVVSGIR